MKLRVLIVDDDRNFRFAMREVIPWEEHGFEVVAEAIHGKQALEILEKQEIDIILTDMEMPVMNGVELTGIVKKQYPEMIVIALSAYDDFEFVKESMRLGAEEYILKQEFDGKKIITVLENSAKQRLEKHQKELDENGAKMEFLEYLRGHITSYNSEKLGRKKLENLKNMSICLVHSEEISGWKGAELQQNQLVFLMNYKDNGWLYIYSLREQSSTGAAYNSLSTIASKLKQSFTTRIKIAFSDLIGSYDQLPEMFARAEAAMKYAMYFPEKQEFHYLDYSSFEKRRIKDYLYQQSSVRTDNIESILEDMKEQLMSYMPEEEYVNRSFTNLYKTCQKGFVGFTGDLNMIGYYNDVKRRYSIADKIEFTLEQLRDNQHFDFYCGNNKEILKAIEYIQKHYSEEITLETIAEYIGLSDNYFSHLFKLEVGENLVSFINKIRIEHAKRLLDNESMKVYEIAELIGYRSSSYFSTIFKKVTGLSISEYKDR